MKRSPLQRKTPLQTHVPLRSKSPMKRRRSKHAKQREFSPAIRDAVTERSGGYCEYCHRHPIASIHHANFRSQLHRDEGSGGLENAIGLCIYCDALVHGGTQGQKYRLIFEELAKELASRQPVDA